MLMTIDQMTWMTADKIKHYGGIRNAGFKRESKVRYWPEQEKIACCNWSRRRFPSVDPFYDRGSVLNLPLPLPLPICASLNTFTWCENILS